MEAVEVVEVEKVENDVLTCVCVRVLVHCNLAASACPAPGVQAAAQLTVHFKVLTEVL